MWIDAKRKSTRDRLTNSEIKCFEDGREVKKTK